MRQPATRLSLRSQSSLIGPAVLRNKTRNLKTNITSLHNDTLTYKHVTPTEWNRDYEYRDWSVARNSPRRVSGVTCDLDANFIVGRWALSQAYIQKGMYAEAIELNEKALQTEPTNPVYLRFAGIAYAKAGRRQEAERIIDRFKEIAKTDYVMSYHVALIYSVLGEKDKAIAELETALSEHDYLLPRIKVEPFFDPLHGDPRFERIVTQLNFPNRAN